MFCTQKIHNTPPPSHSSSSCLQNVAAPTQTAAFGTDAPPHSSSSSLQNVAAPTQNAASSRDALHAAFRAPAFGFVDPNTRRVQLLLSKIIAVPVFARFPFPFPPGKPTTTKIRSQQPNRTTTTTRRKTKKTAHHIIAGPTINITGNTVLLLRLTAVRSALVPTASFKTETGKDACVCECVRDASSSTTTASNKACGSLLPTPIHDIIYHRL